MTVTAQISQNLDPSRQKYEQDGFCKFDGLVPAALADAAIEIYRRVVLPYDGVLMRQSGLFQKHRPSQYGHIQNTILNPHIAAHCPAIAEFSDACLEIVTHPNMQAALKTITGSACNMMQTMMFDYSPGTAPHQDCVYLDSLPAGKLLGAWIALEDINPLSGPFYILPRSKTPPLQTFTRADVFNNNVYMPTMRKVMEQYETDLVCPVMKKGDVIFWNSHIVHGAYNPKDPQFSRKSLAAHYIPTGLGFSNSFGDAYEPVYQRHNGMWVELGPHYDPPPKDQETVYAHTAA